MFSYYKLKVIFWYTSLVSIILISALFASYKFLGYQLRNEIDSDLIKKVQSVNRALRDTKKQSRRRRDFRESIVSGRYTFYDIQQYTEIADNKYVLFIYFGDSLMYLTEKYRRMDLSVEPFKISNRQISDFTIDEIPFGVSALHKEGFSIYIGYELSAIQALQKKLMQIFFAIFPFGVVLSVICGFLVTQRSMNVINAVNKTAARISSENLSERITVPSGKDEISGLIVTLNSMIDRLEKSFAMARQFSQDAAHEIRTPLTIIRGEIEELLGSESCPDDIARTLENVLEEMQYLSSIANKLLLIHSLDSGGIKYHFKEVALDKILEETFQDAQILSAEKRHSINLEIKESIRLMGNEDLMIRLFWNVIDNAIKYTLPEGGINIVLEKTESNAVVRIKDTGIGIPQEEISKIFDRFYRVDKSRSRELGGSGLGLAICKWIIDLHKGEIKVQSEVDKGSEFTILLPL